MLPNRDEKLPLSEEILAKAVGVFVCQEMVMGHCCVCCQRNEAEKKVSLNNRVFMRKERVRHPEASNKHTAFPLKSNQGEIDPEPIVFCICGDFIHGHHWVY